MATVQLLLAFVAVSTAFASDVPVLMWSPNRPLSDLQQVSGIDKISQDAFHHSYLEPLLGKKANVVVAFLQDKLHINDISKYADVYNQHSDGGAFRNIKGLVDEHFSLELPSVLGSHLAIKSLSKDFPGTVHHLTSASDVADLDLGGKGQYLVIIHLKPVTGAKNVEAVISANDELIGEVSKQLEKREVKYTALYTAETSEERQKRDTRQARHLLEAAEVENDGAFFNISYVNGTMYAYLTSVSVCVRPTGEDAPAYCPTNFTTTVEDLRTSVMTANRGANRTLDVQLKLFMVKSNYTNDRFNLTLKMPFKHNLDRWEFVESTLTIVNASTGAVVTQDEVMVTRDYDTVASLLYSYHCTYFRWYSKNTTSPSSATLVLGGFQIQPFNATGSGFALSQDCTGWFTTAIWMGLVPVGISLIILFFGMYMMASLSTNDRFDDPKGKTLTINAGE